MALPSTVYRASIDLSDVDHNRYLRVQTTIAQHPSETAERLIARLFAYALWHEEGLSFTRGVGAGDEPDLWVKDPAGRIRLWLEVGLPDPQRLIKASRHAERTALLAFGPNHFRWVNSYLPQLTRIPNLVIWGLDHHFLQQLSAGLERSIDWSLTVSGGMLYLATAGKTLESSLMLLKDPASP